MDELERDEVPRDRGSGIKTTRSIDLRIAGAGVALVLLLVFILQNTNDTPVEWLVFDKTAPLWVVIVVSAIVGAVLERLLIFALRGRRRRPDRSAAG
jgi:uncharacterized integral membrane protein